MKRILSFLLVLSLLFSVSCARESQLNADTPTTTEESIAVITKDDDNVAEETEEIVEDTYDYPTVCDPLTPEALAALPIASSAMSIDELRQLCLDYFLLQLTFSWTPDSKFSYVVESSDKSVTLDKGSVYAGIPYVTVGTGNLYRVLENYDSETGVLPVSLYKGDPKVFGNQCSVGAFWGWGRVINSADYDWTQNMVKARGFIPVGTYTYPDELKNFTGTGDGGMTTIDICQTNGREIMYESYAKMQPADGIVKYSGTAGHVRMCSVAPVIQYDSEGKIDGLNSYLRYRDQSSKWSTDTQSDGSEISVQGGIDAKVTFQKLYSDSFIPFTFAEFLGTDPVETSSVTVNYSGDSVTLAQLKEGTLTSNYSISDVFLTVYNAQGEEVYEYIKRSMKASVREVAMSELVFPNSLSKYADGTHTVKISCQISTGEKPVVYQRILNQ